MKNYCKRDCNALEVVDRLLQSGIYLSRATKGRVVAQLCGLRLNLLNSLLLEEVGYTIEQLISLYRVQHASIFMREGIPYRKLFRYCGFGSLRELERAQQLIVNYHFFS
ncbi:MAG: hypothetical protein WC960_08065 [Bacteroidales bacterium]